MTDAAFWSRVEKTDGCWPWTGQRSAKGYGIVITAERKKVKAHRIAFGLDKIPHGQQVLHRCDNPPCVRPDHLFLGTNVDNVADCISKGRHAKKKLTRASVAEIRQEIAAGRPLRAVARDRSLDRNTVRDIARGKTWRTALSS